MNFNPADFDIFESNQSDEPYIDSRSSLLIRFDPLLDRPVNRIHNQVQAQHRQEQPQQRKPSLKEEDETEETFVQSPSASHQSSALPGNAELANLISDSSLLQNIESQVSGSSVLNNSSRTTFPIYTVSFVVK